MKNRKTMKDHMADIQKMVDEVQERTPEEIRAIREAKIAKLQEDKRASIPEFEKIENTPNLTLKTLDRIGDRKTVSKQFIADLARKTDIKLVEKTIIEDVLSTMGINQTDKQIAIDFIDSVRTNKVGNSKITAKQKLNFEIDARYLAPGWEINSELPPSKLADAFDKYLTTTKDVVNVKEFTKRVQAELLPLAVSEDVDFDNMRYENISLPKEIRGAVKYYNENIYESPIETRAGNTHFGRGNYDGDRVYPKGYFGHTRTEDMVTAEDLSDYVPHYNKEDDMWELVNSNGDAYEVSNGENGSLTPLQTDTKDEVKNALKVRAKEVTRRVIEVQSDLYQKGNLEKELSVENSITGDKMLNDTVKGIYPKKYAEIKSKQKLRQYNDPTAHFRMVREEIAKAGEEGITRLQFPTGETAMKIEGLGGAREGGEGRHGGETLFAEAADLGEPGLGGDPILPRNIEVGKMITDGADFYYITENLGDGKFKAVPKGQLTQSDIDAIETRNDFSGIREHIVETFDVSGKIDTSNPIYKFYQNELAKYLKNKYQAIYVIDEQGVTWYEVKITPEMGKTPVEAFQKENGAGLMSFEKAKEKLEAYKKRLNLEFDVDFADAIFTGGANNERAYAVTYNNKISLTDNVKASTADHEMVHLVMNNIEKIPAFNGITRDQLIKAVGGKDTESANEKIAEGFQAMVEGAEQSRVPMVLRRFYEKLKILLEDFLKAIGKDINPIQAFYRRLMVAQSKEKVTLQSQPALDRKVQFHTRDKTILAFNEASAEYLRKTRVDFEKVKEEVEGYNVSLIRKDINSVEEVLAQSRDLYLKDKVEFKQADELMKIGDERRMKKSILDNKFANMLKPYFDLRGGDLEKVNAVLMEGDLEAVEYSDFQLDKKGLSQTQKDGYKSARKAFNVAHELLLSEMEENGVKPEEIDQFRAERIGYMPHKWTGRFALKKQVLKTGGDPTDSGSWRTESMDSFTSKRELAKVAKKLEEENTDPKNIRYVQDTLDSLDVDFFSEQRFSFENMKSIISKAKVGSDIKTDMLLGLRNMVKEKGFGRNFIKRTGIQGYEKNEVPQIVANYFAGLNGFITKMEAGKKYYGVLESIDARRQKKFYAWARNSIAYDMGNMTEDIKLKIPGTRFTGELTIDLKQVAFIYYLANDLSFLLTNTTQNFIVGIGELSKLVSGTGKLYKGETSILKAMTDWAVGNLSVEEKQVVTGLLKVGRLGGEMTSELMGFKNNPVYRTVSSKLNKALYHSTSFVEQNVNRVPAFLAARRLLKEKGLTDKEANEQALSVSDDIHFRYGKQHRPVYMRGKKGVLFVFTHYIRSFLYQLSRDLGKKEFMAVAKKLFYTTLIGGTLALPFAKTIKEIVQNIFGDDDDEEIKKELGTWELALQRGIPASYLNIDLSSRVGIDIMLFSKVFDEFGKSGTVKEKVANSLFNLTGAVGGLLFDRLPKGIELVKKGRYLEAGSKLLPDFLGNPLKGYSGAKEGVFSQAGNPLIDEKGDRFTYTTYEALLKAMGYTSTREQLAWDEQAKEWKLKDQQTEDNSVVKDKISKMIRDGDVEGARKYQEEARLSGELSSSTDYVKKTIKDEVIRDSVKAWETSPQTRATLDKMEVQIAKQMYGDDYTASNLTSVTEEFAYRRTFGYDDKNAEDLKKSVSNADKVLVLKRIREELGADAFREFFNKGRKVVQYESGRSGYVLISDPLKDLFLKSK